MCELCVSECVCLSVCLCVCAYKGVGIVSWCAAWVAESSGHHCFTVLCVNATGCS